MANEKENYVKRNVKASVFSDLFEDKSRLIELYKALHPEDAEASEEDISNVTIQNHIVNGIYNDLGFKVGERLIVLVEAQSTWSENIIPRSLIYMAKTLSEYFDKNNVNLYSSAKVFIPNIELYVVYTGEKGNKPDKIILSQEFFKEKKCPIEVEVSVLFGEGDDILCQYVEFCKVFDRYRKKYEYTKKAIIETIKYCKTNDILKEYLEERESEVIDMVDILNDEEYIMRSYTAEIVRDTTKEVTKEVTDNVTKSRDEFAIKSIINLCKKTKVGRDVAVQHIVDDYGKTKEEASRLVEQYYV